MKTGLLCFLLFSAFACAEKKDFKGAVTTGKKTRDVAPVKQGEPPKAIPETKPPIVIEEMVNPKPPTVIEETTKLFEGSQEFIIEKATSSEVDMVWIIDNSGSMSNEIAQVRNNLGKFMDGLAGRVDIRVQLISADEKRLQQFGLSLSPSALAAGHVQHPIEVSSWDLVDKLGTSICPEDTTILPTNEQELNAYIQDTKKGSPFKICSLEIKSILQLEYLLNSETFALRGKVISKMRPTAAKAVVFVTDDDARTQISAENLESTLGFPKGSWHVYGFIGFKSTPACDITKSGDWYQKAATATGGGTFDICAPDWSEHFSKLSANVVQIAGNNFKLNPKPGLKVTRVALDGKVLPSTAYMLDGSLLRILDADLLKSAVKINVDYTYEASLND